MRFNQIYPFILILSIAGCFDQGIEGNQTGTEKKPRIIPTWSALKEFLKKDKGDLKTYVLGEYDCRHFATALKTAARAEGFEAAYVSLRNLTGEAGHAITVFDTAQGPIYIEPQHDQVAYVRRYSPFGAVPMEAVKRSNFVCPSNPSDLIYPLEVEIYQGNIFEYDFYPYYQGRLDCVDQASQAFEAEVATYNNGRSRYTLHQMREWLNNLRLLTEDVGLKRAAPARFIVSDIIRR